MSTLRAIRRTSGFTVIEILVALAVIGILTGIGVAVVRPPSARLYANDVRALVQQARYESVRSNLPIAVVWNAGASAFETVRGSVAQPCDPDTVLNAAPTDRYRRVTVDVEFEGGLVWLPSGQARNCTYGPFDPVIATIGDGYAERTVTVTLTGRVTIQ